MKKNLITVSVCLLLGVSAWAAGDKNEADHTGKNQRDRSEEMKTSGNQSEEKSDINMTAAIRRAVVKDDALSMNAKNVKIITENGDVTLRGPVKSEDEKKKLAIMPNRAAQKTFTTTSKSREQSNQPRKAQTLWQKQF